jgi:hypothetical protein
MGSLPVPVEVEPDEAVRPLLGDDALALEAREGARVELDLDLEVVVLDRLDEAGRLETFRPRVVGPSLRNGDPRAAPGCLERGVPDRIDESPDAAIDHARAEIVETIAVAVARLPPSSRRGGDRMIKVPRRVHGADLIVVARRVSP